LGRGKNSQPGENKGLSLGGTGKTPGKAKWGFPLSPDSFKTHFLGPVNFTQGPEETGPVWVKGPLFYFHNFRRAFHRLHPWGFGPFSKGEPERGGVSEHEFRVRAKSLAGPGGQTF